MDWKLKHILGNLLKKEYSELFSGKEFKKVLAGLKSKDSEILCRYCERAKKQDSFLAQKLMQIKTKTIRAIKKIKGIKKD
jgi:hypothetical protein